MAQESMTQADPFEVAKLASSNSNPYTSPVTVGESQANRPPSLLARLFSPTGRVNRETYVVHSLLNFFVVIVFNYLVLQIGVSLGPGATTIASVIVLWIFIAAIWSEIAIVVKRLNDIGRPAWHCVLFLIPVYNFYLGMVLSLQRGTIGVSRHGADPTQTGIDSDEAVIDSAYQHEMQGDWNRALELYKMAAEKLAGQPLAEYALNCIHRVEGKIRAGHPDAT